VHGGNAILTNKTGDYRDGCTYLRREEVSIINKTMFFGDAVKV
jgi:hypothetical protein